MTFATNSLADSSEKPVNTAKHQAFWDQIDAILIVNLAHRTDRWELLTAKLTEIGVMPKVHRIDAIDGKTLNGYLQRPWFSKRTPENVSRMKAGAAGCCLSHRKAIAYAEQQGFDRVLMMEDDARFVDDLTGRKGEIIAELLSDQKRWDMLYLGFYQKLNKHHVAVSDVIDGELFELWRIRGPLMFHATVLNRSVYQRMLDELPEKRNIWPWMTYWGSMDAWIYNKFGRNKEIRIWATMPKLVVQVANYSDICDRVLSTEESEGSHFDSKLVPLSFAEFEREIDLKHHEVIHQFLKRRGRQLRAWLFGYRKT